MVIFLNFLAFDFKSKLSGYLCFIRHRYFFNYFQLVRTQKLEAKEVEPCIKK